MTNIITQILVEVLKIFGIATKELKRGSAKKFLRKLAGMAALEDALKKLDRLTQEEARMAHAEVLRITHSIRDEVKVVDGKVERVDDKVDGVGDKVEEVGDKVEDIGDKVEDVGDKVEDVGDKVEDVGDKVEDVGDKVQRVGDKVQCVNNKVQVVIDDSKQTRVVAKEIGDKVADVGVRVEGVGNKVDDIDEKVKTVDEKVQVVIDDGKQVRVAAQETSLVLQQAANDIDEIKWNQFIQLLRSWLSPADPSTNHNIARKAQHNGTAAWLFQGQIIIKWKSIGSLLWIHGKPGSGKSVICSSVIHDIMAVCETGSAIMAYFYFDFKDLKKQTCRDLLLSLISQLSTRSSPCCGILHRVYEAHEKGARQPSDDTLKECLKQMLRLPGQRPIFIVLDALDECPDSSGLPPPRTEVLQLVKELVDLRLRGLYICATSRPEVDIRIVLEPLAFRSVSLHDESGQKADIADYVRSVVNSPLSTAMKRWRTDDKNMVIETLTERADGMFRWVYCQLDALQHCFPPNLRQYLNELPETLDETYERILKGINKAQKDNAHRLLQCLTVAVRPLLVEELAELLAFDFQATTPGGVPTLKEDWRWDDEEEAVLSTCSSLIIIITRGDSRVVQFSHFSVKEFLTSSRLTRSPHGEVSRFHIDLEPAHTVMAQACLATLLRLDEEARNSDSKVSPLVNYAAQHWVEHAQFEKVSSRVRDGMDDLFDSSKPYFAAWLHEHDVDKDLSSFSRSRDSVGSPLYYAAFCGLYDLAERLIMKHPDQVNARGGINLFPLPAALLTRHFHIANLLYTHGAVVDVQGTDKFTPLHGASQDGRVDIVRWLLDNGADKNAQSKSLWTPLFIAACPSRFEEFQVLLEHNADVNSQIISGETPLYMVAICFPFSEREDMVRRLLEHGADPNICNKSHTTPLHKASSRGSLEVARLLLSYGAKVDEKDKKGKTPFQLAASQGHKEMEKLLLEHGALPRP
ncbi:hypothetical protein V8E53_002988 [Lactarius tabidus]